MHSDSIRSIGRITVNLLRIHLFCESYSFKIYCVYLRSYPPPNVSVDSELIEENNYDFTKKKTKN